MRTMIPAEGNDRKRFNTVVGNKTDKSALITDRSIMLENFEDVLYISHAGKSFIKHSIEICTLEKEC